MGLNINPTNWQEDSFRYINSDVSELNIDNYIINREIDYSVIETNSVVSRTRCPSED